MNPTTSGLRLSNRDTSHPEIGNPIKELIGIKRRIVPNSASLNPKKLLMVGMREAHEEKQNPERKKYTLRKIRCLCLRSMSARNPVQISGEKRRKNHL
jgi:hypothetical protein